MLEEKLYLFPTTSQEAVSFVLVQLDDKDVQRPIYYTSWVLYDAETRYSKHEKIVFTLITSVQCLRPYFQAHSKAVLISKPLQAILQCLNTSGWMAKWAIKLEKFDISYHPHLSIKEKVLANFYRRVHLTGWHAWGGIYWAFYRATQPINNLGPSCRRTSNFQSGAKLILVNSEGMVVEYALCLLFKATINQANMKPS